MLRTFWIFSISLVHCSRPRDRLPREGGEQYTSSTGGWCRGRIIGSLEIGVLISLLDPTLPLRELHSDCSLVRIRVSSRAFPSLKLQREREREEEMEFRFFFLSNIFQADLSKFRSKLVCFESFNLQYCFLIFLFERRYILLEDIKKIILAAPKKVLGKWSAFTPHLRHGVYWNEKFSVETCVFISFKHAF